VRRLALLGMLAGAVVAAWKVFVRRQGDSELVWLDTELKDVSQSGPTVTGTAGIENRGRQDAVLRKVEGRISAGGRGRVLVTRRGSRPHERGWWESNILEPGQGSVAEVDIQLEGDATGPLVIELDAHEVGRGLIAHRMARFRVPIPLRA
jgi:hypothetical protein